MAQARASSSDRFRRFFSDSSGELGAGAVSRGSGAARLAPPGLRGGRLAEGWGREALPWTQPPASPQKILHVLHRDVPRRVQRGVGAGGRVDGHGRASGLGRLGGVCREDVVRAPGRPPHPGTWLQARPAAEPGADPRADPGPALLARVSPAARRGQPRPLPPPMHAPGPHQLPCFARGRGSRHSSGGPGRGPGSHWPGSAWVTLGACGCRDRIAGDTGGRLPAGGPDATVPFIPEPWDQGEVALGKADQFGRIWGWASLPRTWQAWHRGAG